MMWQSLNEWMRPKKASQPTFTEPRKYHVPRPKCIQIDENKITDFGQQVATSLTLDAACIVLYPGLRRFSGPTIGCFEFDDNDVLHHLGESDYAPGSLFEPGLRILTKADQALICEALAGLATSAVPVTASASRGAGAQGAYGGTSADVAGQMAAMQRAMQAPRGGGPMELNAYYKEIFPLLKVAEMSDGLNNNSAYAGSKLPGT